MHIPNDMQMMNDYFNDAPLFYEKGFQKQENFFNSLMASNNDMEMFTRHAGPEKILAVDLRGLARTD